jgi:hypothetical protein
MIQCLEGSLDPWLPVDPGNEPPEGGGPKCNGQAGDDEPGDSVSGDAVKELVTVFKEFSMAHVSHAKKTNSGSTVTSYREGQMNVSKEGQMDVSKEGRMREGQVTVSVSRSFSSEAKVTVVKSLKETQKTVFDKLSMLDLEKAEITELIIDHLERGKYQFVMLRYICSPTRKALSIVGAGDISKHFVNIDNDHRAIDGTIISKKELDACLLNCSGNNKVLLAFTRLQGYLTFIEQEYYLTKATVTATYRPDPVPWYRSWLPPSLEAEEVIDLRLVYNVTAAFVERMLTQLKIRLDHMKIEPAKEQSVTSEPAASGSPPGIVVPKSVSVAVTPPTALVVKRHPDVNVSGVFVIPYGGNNAQSDESDTDSIVSDDQKE